jgi:hypothetical protein
MADAGMTPGERRALSTVLKQQMKILRADIEQRRAELLAEAEGRLLERYRDDDRAIQDANFRIGEIVEQANRDIKNLLSQLTIGDQTGFTVRYHNELRAQRIGFKSEDRDQLHRALMSGIDSQVKTALLDLERKEADLLRQLALNSIESDEAREFLANIPKVADLVPTSRLREIEASFDRPSGGEVRHG